MAKQQPTSKSKQQPDMPDGEGAGPSFEDRLEELEQAIADLESGDLPLEQQLERYAAGVEELRALYKLVADAEARVEALLETADGSLVSQPVEASDDDEDERAGEG